ncbi:MAG: phasin family protein [Novosphingobium sp.]|jgi:hypothetical protein|nr:phasin family protein [Novosphingobium sp.]
MATDSKTAKSTLVTEVQGKARTAYAKGSAVAGEIGSMAKGNVAAVVQSGKILGAGLKTLGEGSLAEGKQAVDTLAADLKALASVKSPAELLKLQFRLAQRNVDAAFALGAKNADAIGKLAGAVAAPISLRIGSNVARLRNAA